MIALGYGTIQSDSLAKDLPRNSLKESLFSMDRRHTTGVLFGTFTKDACGFVSILMGDSRLFPEKI